MSDQEDDHDNDWHVADYDEEDYDDEGNWIEYDEEDEEEEEVVIVVGEEENKDDEFYDDGDGPQIQELEPKASARSNKSLESQKRKMSKS